MRQSFIAMIGSKFFQTMAGVAFLTAAFTSHAFAQVEVELILKKESLYNSLFVLQEGPYRTLRFGHKDRHYRESTYNPADPTELPSTYTQYVTVGAAYPQDVKHAAVIGMGGGRMTWYLSHYMPDLKVTAVELDPEIVKIADKYFDVRANDQINVVTSDGRTFIRRTKETFDFIIVDAYRGHFVPFHLLTKEFYEMVEERMNDGGVVVQNIAPSTMLFDHAIATIGAVFDNVDLYKAGGNMVAVAYNGPHREKDDLLAAAQAQQDKHGFRYDIAAMIDERVRTPEFGDDKILTDDFAPANYLKSVENHNRKWENE
ncbi:fused MFS/spermidine synthase [Hyphococcus flavus]|uniref:Fused MFS/spermidine synthase n=1 Tax=Hyphococcus flavus TaxID=1866326 RepID=A0AAE9ZH56_9PROT|nr:fused MFS/spermidine synthase [Hyphococcus flavus]WDI32958.1 fused MFS/spermidine synthase [Hyphococcus flavus]